MTRHLFVFFHQINIHKSNTNISEYAKGAVTYHSIIHYVFTCANRSCNFLTLPLECTCTLLESWGLSSTSCIMQNTFWEIRNSRFVRSENTTKKNTNTFRDNTILTLMICLLFWHNCRIKLNPFFRMDKNRKRVPLTSNWLNIFFRPHFRKLYYSESVIVSNWIYFISNLAKEFSRKVQSKFKMSI